jgi:DnaJ-class molecular chaperone
MAELIRCSTCEGWGVTAYEKDGTPIKCERCDGTGKVEKPPEPVYALTRCQAAIKEVLDLAEETTNSNNAEARELAELVVKLFSDFELVEAEDY